MRVVLVSSSTLDLLSEKELKCVLSHEMWHQLSPFVYGQRGERLADLFAANSENPKVCADALEKIAVLTKIDPRRPDIAERLSILKNLS